MNIGYVLYIQSCSKFWNDPAYNSVKQDLIREFSGYQFLGICAIMWRFLKPQGRRRWTEEAKLPKPRFSALTAEVAALAKITLKQVQ